MTMIRDALASAGGANVSASSEPAQSDGTTPGSEEVTSGHGPRLWLFCILVAVSLGMPHAALGAGVSLDDLPPIFAFLAGCALVWPERRRLRRLVPPRSEVLPLLAVTALTAVAAVASGSLRSLGSGPVRWGLTTALIGVAYVALRQRGAALLMLKVVAGVVALEAVFGLLSFTFGWSWWNGYVGIEKFRGYESVAKYFPGRITGTLGQAATFVAGAFTLGVPLMVGLAMDSRGLRRLVWGAAAAATYLALFFTFSRVPLLLATAAVLVLVLVRTPWWCWVCTGGVLYAALFLTPMKDRMLNDGNDRQQLWWAAWQMWRAHPLLGVGPGRYTEFLPAYANTPFGVAGATPHNSVLLMAAESGTLAGIAVAVAILLSLRGVRRSLALRRTRPLVLATWLGAACFAADAMTTNLYFIPSVALSAWMVAPSLTALGRPDAPDARGSRRLQPSWRAVITSVVVLAMLALAGLGAPSSTPAGRPSAPRLAATPGVCHGAALPAGFAVTGQMPHAVKTPYADTSEYNPTAISNFINEAAKDPRTTTADKTCLGVFAGEALIRGSRTSPGPEGHTARWFPYRFEFSANPAVSTLHPGWVSGLAQGSALTSLTTLFRFTGDQRWLDYGRQTFETFLVPESSGGFSTRAAGRLWFQAYPTNPPTSVLNGHMDALMGLINWERQTGDPRAARLIKEAASALEKTLPFYEVSTAQGILASYDLVRGLAAAPLRIVSETGMQISSAHVVGMRSTYHLTQSVRAPLSRDLLADATLAEGSGPLPRDWQLELGSVSHVRRRGPAVTITSGDGTWESLAHVVPAGSLRAGTTYRLSWRSKVRVPDGKPGTSGRVSAVAMCPHSTRMIADSLILRSRQMTRMGLTVTLPNGGCSLKIILYQAKSDVPGTEVTFDQVTLRRADSVGGAARPVYPLSVLSAPVSRLALTFNGSGELQAYSEGRWSDIATLDSGGDWASTAVVIPERYTGRNLHFGYHEVDVDELAALYNRTGDQTFLKFAERWLPMAPSRNAVLPRTADAS